MELSSVSANELVRVCIESGDEAAWGEFVRRFQRPIALAVLRTARCWNLQSPALLDDLVQETFLRLCADDCRLLRNFVPREPDSIVGYLKVLAANVTHDKLRNEKALKRGGAFVRQDLGHSSRQDPHEPGPSELDTLAATPTGTETVDRSLRHSEIDNVLRSFIPDRITARDRTIFWLYFDQGFSAREISEIPSVALSVKGVESSIHRTTEQVREALAPRAAATNPKGISNPFTIYKEEP